MKRFLSIVLFVCLLAAPAYSGEIPIGPTPPPPACTENCVQETPMTPPITYEMLLLLIKLPRV